MEVVVYVRSDVDWCSLRLEDYVHHHVGRAPGMKQQYVEKLVIRIKWWNDLYKMDFFTYRRRLRDIASISFDRIVGLDAVVRSHKALRRMDWLNKPTWVLPIDDDDWYHPEIANYCRQFDPEKVSLLTWPMMRFTPTILPGYEKTEIPIKTRKPREDFAFLLTNMYGVSSYGMRSIPPDFRLGVLARHGQVLDVLKTYGGIGYKEIEGGTPMAVTHKSPGSCTQLTAVDSPQGLVRFIETGRDSIEKQADRPAWTTPCAVQANQLLNELIESKK